MTGMIGGQQTCHLIAMAGRLAFMAGLAALAAEKHQGATSCLTLEPDGSIGFIISFFKYQSSYYIERSLIIHISSG